MPPAMRDDILKRHRSGESDRRIARALGIHKTTVYRVKKDAGLTAWPTPHRGEAPGPKVSKGASPSGKSGGGQGRTMGEGGESLETTIALLKRDRADDAKRMEALTGTLNEIADGLKKATRQPPTFEAHDGAAHIACPNCGTSRDVPLPAATAAGPESFDDVIALMDSQHREAGGKKWTDCPSCKPKMEAKLAEFGYGKLTPVATGEGD